MAIQDELFDLAWTRQRLLIETVAAGTVKPEVLRELLVFARDNFVAGWAAGWNARAEAIAEEERKLRMAQPPDSAKPRRDPVSWNPFRPQGLQDGGQMLTIECALPPGRGSSVRGRVPFDVVLRYAVDREVLAHVLGQAVVDGVLLRLRGMDQ